MTGVDGAAVTVTVAQELEPTLDTGPVAILLRLVAGVLVSDYLISQDVVTGNVVSKTISWLVYISILI